MSNDYLDETHPEHPLNPKDPYKKARQRILLERWGKVHTINRVFHRLSAVQECQHCQIRFSSAIKKSTCLIKHVTFKCDLPLDF